MEVMSARRYLWMPVCVGESLTAVILSFVPFLLSILYIFLIIRSRKGTRLMNNEVTGQLSPPKVFLIVRQFFAIILFSSHHKRRKRRKEERRKHRSLK